MEKSQQHHNHPTKPKNGIWVTLIVLPFIFLFLIAIAQGVIRGIRNTGGGLNVDPLLTTVNIFSVIFGVVAVLMLITLPVWIVMLVRGGKTGPRSKTTAVVLAALLTFWTWLYTYDRDAWKFWLNLILCIVTVGFWGIVSWFWAVIDTILKPEEFYKDYPNGPGPKLS